MGKLHAMRKKLSGTIMAFRVPILSATFPRMAGMTAPPQTLATKKEAPRFVWRPRPRRDRVKIVGKMHDSKNRTIILSKVSALSKMKNDRTYSMARPPQFGFVAPPVLTPMARAMNSMISVW